MQLLHILILDHMLVLILLLHIVMLVDVLTLLCLFLMPMVPYLLLDYPELSVREAMKLSREMTRGYKWDLFVLDLTFIGWILLSILTLGIGGLVVEPYQQAARSAFYEDLKSQRIVEEN